MWGLDSLLLRENLSIVIILPFVGLDYTTSVPLLAVSLWFLLYVFSCRRSFIPVSRSLSWILLCR